MGGIEIQEDHISNLPNDIIGKALSLLPTKDVVRTSILSKNWEHKWTFVKNIQIDDECVKKSLFGYVGINSFIRFVDRTLDLTGNSEINNFRLSCTSYDPRSLPLPRWISTILERKIKYLDLKSGQRKSIVLPLRISNCSLLTELKLSLPCKLQILTQNCFPNLKVLYLGRGTVVQIGKDCLNNTVLTFPVLQKLILDHCKWLPLDNDTSVEHYLMLVFPVLEDLVLDNCRWLNINSLEIKAPALTTFKNLSCHIMMICGDKYESASSSSIGKFVLEAPSIYHAILSGGYSVNHDIFAQQSRMILEAVQGLKFLTTYSLVLEVLIQAKPRLDLPIFHQLRRLELICSNVRDANYKDVMEILEVLPVLESLTTRNLRTMFDDFYVEQVEHVPLCIRSHLKEVKFHQYEVGKCQLDLPKFFLKEASNLERMFVYIHKPHNVVKREEIETKIRCELSKLRKSSSSVSIVFKYEEDK